MYVREYGQQLTPELVDLLQQTLCKDPTRRISLAALMHHPWTRRGHAADTVAEWDAVRTENVTPDDVARAVTHIVPSLELMTKLKLMARRKLKRMRAAKALLEQREAELRACRLRDEAGGGGEGGGGGGGGGSVGSATSGLPGAMAPVKLEDLQVACQAINSQFEQGVQAKPSLGPSPKSIASEDVSPIQQTRQVEKRNSSSPLEAFGRKLASPVIEHRKSKLAKAEAHGKHQVRCTAAPTPHAPRLFAVLRVSAARRARGAQGGPTEQHV
jgi:hypothetical protein